MLGHDTPAPMAAGSVIANGVVRSRLIYIPYRADAFHVIDDPGVTEEEELLQT